MKNSLNDLSKLFARTRYGTELRPARDWLVLLVITILCMCLSLAWNLWQFGKVTSGGAIGEGTAPHMAETVSLEGVTQLFEARAAEEARYLNEYRFVDPSR